MAYLVRRLLENTSNESFVRRRFKEGRELDALLAAPRVKELPEPGRETPDAAPRGAPPATLEQVEQAARWASEIADDELRALVARAAAASLARGSE